MEITAIEVEVVTPALCRGGRLHAERTASDATAGILASYGPAMIPSFTVHCGKCCASFGPFPSLALAQGAGRECPRCVEVLFASRSKRSPSRRRRKQ